MVCSERLQRVLFLSPLKHLPELGPKGGITMKISETNQFSDTCPIALEHAKVLTEIGERIGVDMTVYPGLEGEVLLSCGDIDGACIEFILETNGLITEIHVINDVDTLRKEGLVIDEACNNLLMWSIFENTTQPPQPPPVHESPTGLEPS